VVDNRLFSSLHVIRPTVPFLRLEKKGQPTAAAQRRPRLKFPSRFCLAHCDRAGSITIVYRIAPVHPPYRETPSGCAVSVTTARLYDAAHVLPQLIPPELDVTVAMASQGGRSSCEPSARLSPEAAALVPVPPVVVTVSGPVVAAAGTVAWIESPSHRDACGAHAVEPHCVTPVKFVR